MHCCQFRRHVALLLLIGDKVFFFLRQVKLRLKWTSSLKTGSLTKQVKISVSVSHSVFPVTYPYAIMFTIAPQSHCFTLFQINYSMQYANSMYLRFYSWLAQLLFYGNYVEKRLVCSLSFVTKARFFLLQNGQIPRTTTPIIWTISTRIPNGEVRWTPRQFSWWLLWPSWSAAMPKLSPSCYIWY